ncbi:MAG: LacI family DNA-binding transcriptional regulator, partial [Selenomonadaceae bacterium]|nr:LacI family DNA-binding transcriptional regulator [Selenomonadaceae bacterium]
MAVTIRDVAALAGVSPATVSRTCNNNPAISAETREKVWQAIAQLGYQVTSSGSGAPDQETGASGSGKAAGRPQTIGIIMRPQAQKGYDNPFVTRSIRGISQEAMEQNYSIYLSNCDREYRLTDRQVQNLLELNVHGIISVYLDT